MLNYRHRLFLILNKMQKLVQTVVDVEILSGERKNDQTTPRLKSGTVVSIAFYPFSTPTSNVNVKLESNKGEELHPAVTYKNFVPNTGGSYNDAFKPILFPAGDNIEIYLTSKIDLTADFKGQFIFNILQDI